jgi:two-component system sensor histidine kinase YesM
MKNFNMYYTKKASLQTKLIRLFIMTSAVPILFISFFSFYNISNTLKKNTEELTINNLEQISNSLNIWLESYEDILYQIYTDDDVVTLVDKLNSGKDVEVSKNQLRRFLRGILNTKDYIRSITVITSEGMIIAYDQLTSSSSDKSWLPQFSLSQDQLYEEISKDNSTHIFSTEYGVSFANKDYYLFHMAHRIIDYKDLTKKNGVVIVSIDEKLLSKVCIEKDISYKNRSDINFIVDQKGRLISYNNEEQLTNTVTNSKAILKDRKEDYLNFISQETKIKKEYLSVYVFRNEELSWDIVNVTNQWADIRTLSLQQQIVILVGTLSLLIAISLTVWLSRRLVSSVKKVTEAMYTVSTGNLETKVNIEKQMPLEIEFIALQFNDMLVKLYEAIKKENEAKERQLDAEIRALEAQINPHFLYNTLDTINWMAINKEDYDISNAINSLAMILRYAITNSNATVEIHQELDWLKNYIYLQQIRLKNTFHYELDVDPQILNDKVHKLILQPFVENAIIHGFEGITREHILIIKLELKDDFIRILIKDNGKGIEPAVVEEINNKVFNHSDRGSHIGMENVISRLFMYYGEAASVQINSILDEETEVVILIPRRT